MVWNFSKRCPQESHLYSYVGIGVSFFRYKVVRVNQWYLI